MKKFLLVLSMCLFLIGIFGNASAFFIDFKNGTDGAAINDITGVSFQDFNEFDSRYADSRT
jgi:hypothetical protein